jgi:hypothetical protein
MTAMSTRTTRRPPFNPPKLVGLPMPLPPMPPGKKLPKLSGDEVQEHRDRHARHIEQFPDYDAGWGRPTPETAEAVWSWLSPRLKKAGITLSDLFPKLKRPENETAALTLQAKQSLVVALDVFVNAGRYKRTVTYNHVFDAVARRWSDNYRAAVTEGRASQVQDMTKDTAQASRRDLGRVGVRLDTLWKIVTGPWSARKGENPLYYVRRLPYSGYQVRFRKQDDVDAPALVEFERLVKADREYRRHPHAPRLLPAEDPMPERELRQRVAAEVPYDRVRLGPRSDGLLAAQERTRLLLDTQAVREDFHAAERAERQTARDLQQKYGLDPEELSTWRPRPPGAKQPFPSERDHALRRLPARQRCEAQKLIETYDRAVGLTANLRDVVERVGDAGELLIQSRHTRVINRRIHPVDFWPVEAPAKVRPWDEEIEDHDLDWDDLAHGDWRRREIAARWRWFLFQLIQRNGKGEGQVLLTDPKGKGQWVDYRPMVGADVSSSQTQILALLLGIDDLERVAVSLDPPFKKYLAAEAWRRRRGILRPGYTGPDDPRLVALVKATWMQVLYGSSEREIVWKQLDASPATFGPGWAGTEAASRAKTAKAKARVAARGAQAIKKFLGGLPWYDEVSRFLTASRRLAQRAHKKDKYAGVTFLDPFDKAEIRWNPVARADVALSSDGHKLIVSLPGRCLGGQRGRPCSWKKFRPARPNAAGDYPVDAGKLRRRVAPMLVHVLDAYLSGLVLERLAARGVPAVGIHDAWLTPDFIDGQDGLKVLQEVLDEAAVEWFKRLGPVYTRLVDYLGDDPHYGAFVQGIKGRWERRKAEAKTDPRRWPRFAVARSDDPQARMLDSEFLGQ